MGTLIKPAGREIGFPGDTHLQARGVCQVNFVVLHAEILGEAGISAGSLAVVAALWADNADIAFSQLLKAGITIALVKTFVGFSATVLAADFLKEADPYGLAYKRVKV